MCSFVRIPAVVATCACLLGVAACTEPSGRHPDGGLTGIGAHGADPDADLDDEGSGSASDGDGLDDDGLDDDGGGPPGHADDGGSEQSCRSIDFLFVIDSSISMATNQAELVAAFPAFVETMTNVLEDVDSYHVGVVTSGTYAGNAATCTQLGALVTQTAGPNSSAAECGPFAEGRYMTEVDDLATGFACAAKVGTGGDNDEKMMNAALAAISPEMNAPGACNEGFIRDDALLVLVLITDEDDPGSCAVPLVGCSGSSGDPSAWHQEVLARKQHPENAVVLSLTRGAPANVCGVPSLAEIDAQRIMTFAGMFQDNGFQGDICAPFGPFFEEAVGVVESACDSYVPVG